MTSSSPVEAPGAPYANPPLIALAGNPESEKRLCKNSGFCEAHRHSYGQLFCVETGMVQIKIANGSWLLPPGRAGWLPPNEQHQVRIIGNLTGWQLLISPEAVSHLPDVPGIIHVTDVLHALAQRAISWENKSRLTPEQARIIAVILDEIRHAQQDYFHLPLPLDPRLLTITEAILADPASGRTLNEWAKIGAMSGSSLRRRLLKETGMNFSHWKQQARLASALEMLIQGTPVSLVSDALGYASTSNFIAMFRRVFGDSPHHFMAGKGFIKQT